MPRFLKKQKAKFKKILADEILYVAEFYGVLSRCAVKIMKEHAPRAVGDTVEEVIEQIIFFRTVGMIGALAAHSGELHVCFDKAVRPAVIFENAKDEK